MVKMSFPVHFLFNPFNAELNLICHLLALIGGHHIFHASTIRVKWGQKLSARPRNLKHIVFLSIFYTKFVF